MCEAKLTCSDLTAAVTELRRLQGLTSNAYALLTLQNAVSDLLAEIEADVADLERLAALSVQDEVKFVLRGRIAALLPYTVTGSTPKHTPTPAESDDRPMANEVTANKKKPGVGSADDADDEGEGGEAGEAPAGIAPALSRPNVSEEHLELRSWAAADCTALPEWCWRPAVQEMSAMRVVPRCAVGSPKAMRLMAAGMPVILTGSHVLGEPWPKWDLPFLKKNMSGAS